MTKSLRSASAALALAAVLPLSAHAAWWSFLEWKPAAALPKEQPQEATTSAPVGISVSHVSNTPSVEELQNTISALQAELRDALAKIDDLTKAAASKPPAAVAQKPTAAPASADASSLSQKAIIAKVKPAIVSVETATSSGSGAIIDAQGHILTTAHIVWIEDAATRSVIGAADQVSVTLADGTKTSARLVGIDEGRDLAVLQLSSKRASSYLKLNYDGALATGQSAYVFSVPAINGGSTGGQGFVAGTISKKTSSTIEITSDTKPLDTGGALVNDAGGLIGVPNRSNCKVIQDMTTCLKYTVTANIARATLPKLLLGMRLYKQRANESYEETAVKGEFQGMYQSASESGVLDIAISSASGRNNFDLFNDRLGKDQDGKMTKLYLTKLKQISENMYQASDFLKSQADALNVFFQNESAAIAGLGDYQRATIARLQADNALKLKEYTDKVAFWSRKKNEYDSYIADPSRTTHDYLMTEGAFEESSTAYFTKERQRILDVFSGETVDIF